MEKDPGGTLQEVLEEVPESQEEVAGVTCRAGIRPRDDLKERRRWAGLE